MQCNICMGREFIDFNGRVAILCSTCKSAERHRLLWFYLERLGLTPASRVLHLGPEPGIYGRLAQLLVPANYDVRDFSPERYAFATGIKHIDLSCVDTLPSDHYDLIVHSHVLEHVLCNIAHPLYHLHRALKPHGKHVFQVPFNGGRYDECFQDIGSAERIRRFGQDDHVRSFGSLDVSSHLGKLLDIDDIPDAGRDFSAARLEEANIPRQTWQGLSPSTTFCLDKYQMTLLAP